MLPKPPASEIPKFPTQPILIPADVRGLSRAIILQRSRLPSALEATLHMDAAEGSLDYRAAALEPPYRRAPPAKPLASDPG